jgi:hypothetical protein
MSSHQHALLSHDVFFTLEDGSPEAAARLAAACHDHLGSLPGIVHFTAGTRNEALDREVNDLTFHVALHVVFADRESHDAYQAAPEHDVFIAENMNNWAAVRVFDSEVTGGAR